MGAIVLALAALSACANMNSISRTRYTNTSGALVHYADAKQWGVLSTRTDGGKPAYRSCAQPPPDAFSVLAYSLAGAVSGSLNPLPDGDEKALQAEIAQSLSESGSTIQRTQTVNVLRESMYRTCERYMNGAITEDQFVVQAARDQRAMIAVLAIEQLTGVVMPQPTVLVANASATSSDSHLEVIKRYETYQKRLLNAKAKVSEQKTAAENYNKAQSGACAKILDGDKPTAEPALANWTECESLKKKLTDAGDPADLSAEQSAAEIDFANMQLIIKGGPGGQGSASSASGTPGSGIDPALPTDRAAIAGAVQAITSMAFSDTSELMFVCVTELRKAKDQNVGLQKTCLDYMSIRIREEAEKSLLVRYSSGSVDSQLLLSGDWFDIVARYVVVGAAVSEDKVRSLIAGAKGACSNCFALTARNDQLATASSRAKLEEIFMTYPAREQMMLADFARRSR